LEKRYLRKDGSSVTAIMSTALLRDAQSNPLFFITNVIDITERKQAEATIQTHQSELQRLLLEADLSRRILLGVTEDQNKAEESLRQEQYLMNSLMDTIPDMIYFKDLQGRYIRVNKAQADKLRVTDPKELLGKTDFDYFSKEHAQAAYADELSIIQTGNFQIDNEELLTYVDRPAEWVSATKMPLYNEKHEIIGTYGLSRDISERKQTEKQLQNAYSATLEGWAAALELRERETANHSKRVVQYTIEIAKKLGLSEAEIMNAQRGALLHDIGKMGVPDSILLKPGPLSEDEWVIMRMHPVFAFNLLSEITYLQPALDIPYAHHERWNGSGYPLGLKETNIPLSARIFAVVDVWDALSSDRPYRPAWNHNAVIKYLKEQSGIQFDPQIVDIFLELIEPAQLWAGLNEVHS
ncbi:MAG: HD domain-containing phosphohydrolase, partial [Leptolinea sp.]